MFPNENLLLQNLKSERWKDILGYEGYYQVSNYGRVKSLDRIIPHPRLYKQFVQGRILKQKIVKDYNKLTGDAMVSLQVALALENTIHYYNVRRLVYLTFKEKIDFKKDGLYVINRDSNGYNNKLTNLQLVSKSKKQCRSIERGRHDFSYLKTIDRSSWKKSTANNIPVSQYTLSGELVKKFSSLRAASKLIHIDSKGISLAAKGFYKGVWSGYKWKF
jgi:NUMOD4 motif/NUMOD1 domain